MKIFKATRVRLYPTPEQEIAFAKIAGCCRLLYNLGLEQRRDHWRRYKTVTGKTISWYDQKKEIKALKAVAPFLAEVPNHCLQETLHNLHTAYTRFFEAHQATQSRAGSSTTTASHFQTRRRSR